MGHEVFSPERSLNQPKATHACIRSINQSNRSISVRLLFLFRSRVFISRSYENRSNRGTIRRLAAQSSVWTERKYWTVPCEKCFFSWSKIRPETREGSLKFLYLRQHSTQIPLAKMSENSTFCSPPLGLSRSTLWLGLFSSGTLI